MNAETLQAAAISIDHGTADIDEIETWLDNPMRCTAGDIMEKAARLLIAHVRTCGKRLSDAELCVEAVSEIRQMLYEAEVPSTSFIDEHVRNAIAQRNRATKALEQIRDLGLTHAYRSAKMVANEAVQIAKETLDTINQ